MCSERVYHVPQVVLNTSVKQQIDRYHDLCWSMPNPSNLLIVGPKGVGKSTALRAMADSADVFYTEATHANKSLTNLLRAILAENGHHDVPQYTADRFEAVVRVLKADTAMGAPKRTLIIDEVQKIEWSAWLDICHIGERSGCTIIFSGNEHSLVSGRKNTQKEILTPISSRISIRLEVGNPIERDFEILASSFGVEGMDAYRACSAYGMRTDFRSLEQLLAVARQIAGDRTIQLVHLRGAAIMKHPTNADQVLLPRTNNTTRTGTHSNGLSSQLSVSAE